MLEVRLLGQFDTKVDGLSIEIPSRQAQSLLAYLLLHPGVAHRREKLAGLFWPAAAETNARGYLRQTLWRVRKLIETGGHSYLLADDLSITFNSNAEYWLDAAVVAQPVADSASADDLVHLVAAYSGELLPGFYDEWVVLERERLQALFERKMQALLECLIEARRWLEILHWGERWIALGYAPEPAYRALMVAYGGQGDLSGVASVYQRCVKALRRELGVKPSAQTHALYQRLSWGERPPSAHTPEISSALDALIPQLLSQRPEDRTPSTAEVRQMLDGLLHPAAFPGAPPFKGLQHFDEADADLFFGREALIAKLVGRLREHRFLAVIGASGSGKSSVVRAGLVSALRRGAPLAGGALPLEGSAVWRVHAFTPSVHPLEALAASLTRDLASVKATATLMDDMASDVRSLHLYARRLLCGGAGDGAPLLPLPHAPLRLLLVVDQFEELFTLCRSDDERTAFVDNLLTAISGDDEQTFVVLTLRADFYAHCALYANLREALASHQEYIGPMDAEELRRAVEEPARRSGCAFEPGLVDLLLRDAGGEPGALPLLSHALLETWHRRQGRALTLEGYAECGGVREAIARTAETVFHHRLTPEQQTVARNIFLRLTELGEGTQDTCRRVALNELITQPQSQPMVESVLKTLADARLITLSATTAEVAHEALIREWPTLREWLAEDRDGLRLQRHLTETALEWDALGRDPGELYRGARLAQALEWAEGEGQVGDLNALEREFLQVSKELAEHETAQREAQHQRGLEAAKQLAEAAQQLAATEKAGAEAERRRAEEQTRTARQLRRRAWYLVSAFVVALIAALAAGVFDQQAIRNLRLADQNLSTARAANLQAAAHQATAVAERNRAESQRLAAEAGLILQRHESAEMAALLANHALQIQYSPQADAALQQSSRFDYGLRLFVHPAAPVTSVAFSPEGRYLLTGSDDHQARLWEAATGKLVRLFAGHTGAVDSVAFSPDGQYVLTGSEDKTARLWEAATGREVSEFVGHADFVLSVAFSPDGQYVLTGSFDNTARLWETTTGREVRRFTGHADALFSVAVSPDGQYVLTGSRDKTARLWEAATGREVRPFTGHTGPVVSVAFSPDSRYVLTGSLDNTARLWEAATGQEVQRFTGHRDIIMSAAFSPNGQYVLTGSRDKTARLWEVATGQEVRSFTGHTDSVVSLAFSPDGQYVLTGSSDNTARLWEANLSQDPRQFTGHTDWVWTVAFLPDGRHALTASYDKTVRLWDVVTGKEALQFVGHTAPVFGLAVSRDGRYALTGSGDKTARLWEVATGQEVRRFNGHTDSVFSVAFSPDGRYVLTGSRDRTARLWEMATGKEVRQFTGHQASVFGVAFSPDGQFILTASEDKIVRLWTVATGQLVRQFMGHAGPVNGVAFSPDGQYVLTGSDDKTARLWAAATGQEVRQFIGHTGPVNGVAFSPDGQYVLTGSVDNTARLWKTDTGQEARQFTGHIGSVWAVAFSADGKYVLTGSEDDIVRLWDTDYHDLIRWVCSRVLRDLTEAERFHYDIADTAPTCLEP